MKIFLDDKRKEPDGWVRTYTVEKTIKLLETGKVTHLSLDNDLGNGLTEGHKVLIWLEQKLEDDSKFPMPEITIHSMNNVRHLMMKSIAKKLVERYSIKYDPLVAKCLDDWFEAERKVGDVA